MWPPSRLSLPLFHDPATAYVVVKLLNCALVSTASVPAYLLGRRVLDRRPAARLFGGHSARPGRSAYSTKVMTESLAYPVFLWAVLVHPASARAAQRPFRVSWHCIILVAVLTRQGEMIALLPAFASALLVAAELPTPRHDRGPVEGPAPQPAASASWSSIAGFAVLGRSAALAASEPAGLLGPHTAVGETPRPSHVRLWMLVYHAAELNLAPRASHPLVAFAHLVYSIRRNCRRRSGAFVLTTASIGIWLLGAGRPSTRRNRHRHALIYERYTFYLAPLLVLVVFSPGRSQGAQTHAACVFCSRWLPPPALPLAIPFGDDQIRRPLQR